MILQVVADWQIELAGDAQGGQCVRGADTGELQELRTSNSTSAVG